jgi:hypothetical protein
MLEWTNHHPRVRVLDYDPLATNATKLMANATDMETWTSFPALRARVAQWSAAELLKQVRIASYYAARWSPRLRR